MKQGYLSEIFVSFQGEGAHVGERHLFVRLAGCNIRCVYCDTPDSLERTSAFTIFGPGDVREDRPNPVDARALRSLIDSILQTQGPIDAVAVTGGEPLVQSAFIAAVFGGVPLDVPVLLETNGILPQRLTEVLGVVDIVSMDIKLPTNSRERPFWDEHIAFAKLAGEKDLYAKILVDADTSADDVCRAADVIAAAAPGIETFLQPINRIDGSSTIGAQHLATLFRCVRERHVRCRVVPQTHKAIGLR